MHLSDWGWAINRQTQDKGALPKWFVQDHSSSNVTTELARPMGFRAASDTSWDKMG